MLGFNTFSPLQAKNYVGVVLSVIFYYLGGIADAVCPSVTLVHPDPAKVVGRNEMQFDKDTRMPQVNLTGTPFAL